MQEVLKVHNKSHYSPPLHSPFAPDLRDLDLVNHLSNGKVDLTYGRCVKVDLLYSKSQQKPQCAGYLRRKAREV